MPRQRYTPQGDFAMNNLELISNQSNAEQLEGTEDWGGLLLGDEDYKLFNKEYSVLLIDDDGDQRVMFEAILERSGLNVFTAESAERALQMMSFRHFDVVITDLRMPDMNGFDLVTALRAVRTFPSGSRIPIILLTACSGDLEYAAMQMGADMFCEKRRAHKLLISQIKLLIEDTEG